MTWQLASFSILILALAGGFAWYERTRPDARIVALVATLAAFAALGRVAFAAVPNVKPTTDIVLIAGYALGGGPGFVVGALAGLTSNFFFGQGPWTPWQMAAWGATGLIGAGLAVLTKRTLGRWSMALICGVVGFAFTAVQDFGDWVTYSDHSVGQLRVYVAKGIGFDLVHAIGCVLFALAFGPALARSIGRFAARLKVTWRPAGSATATVIAALLLGAGFATAAGAPAARAAGNPTTYLLSAQNGDGGFGASPGASSSQLFSGWAALGLAAEGLNLRSVSHGGPSLIAYISAGSPTDVGSLERTILVLRAAGLPATAQVAALQRDVRADGSVSDQVNLTSFAMLALRAAGVAPPSSMTAWLSRQQDSDGGFNFATAGGTSDVDDTGAALEALSRAGSGSTISRAVAFLRHQQNPDGGFPSDPGEDSNAQSSAWAIQGLIAAGASPDALPHGSASAYLRSLIAADGHVRYSRSADQTPVWVTAQAAMALAGKPLPFPPPPAATGGAASGAGAAGRSASVPGQTHHTTPSATSAHAAKVVHHHAHPGSGSASDSLGQLAIDAGIAAALVLAPIGQ